MLNKTLLIFFFTGLFAGQSLFKLGNQAYFDFDFFDTVPYSEWALLDTTKKSEKAKTKIIRGGYI